MGKLIYTKGVPTPRYKAQQIRQDNDPDVFVDLLANHPEHIARSKAKWEAYVMARAKEAADEVARIEARERLLNIVGHIAVFALLALMVAVAL